MKPFAFWGVAALIFLSGVVGIFLTRPSPLSAYEWRYTPVLIFSPSLKDIRLPDQIRKLGTYSLEFRERAMILVSIIGQEPVMADRTAPPFVMPDTLRRQFGVTDRQFVIIMLDIDGTELFRREIDDIYSVIRAPELIAAADAATTRRNVAKWGPKPVRTASQRGA